MKEFCSIFNGQWVRKKRELSVEMHLAIYLHERIEKLSRTESLKSCGGTTIHIVSTPLFVADVLSGSPENPRLRRIPFTVSRGTRSRETFL